MRKCASQNEFREAIGAVWDLSTGAAILLLRNLTAEATRTRRGLRALRIALEGSVVGARRRDPARTDADVAEITWTLLGMVSGDKKAHDTPRSPIDWGGASAAGTTSADADTPVGEGAFGAETLVIFLRGAVSPIVATSTLLASETVRVLLAAARASLWPLMGPLCDCLAHIPALPRSSIARALAEPGDASVAHMRIRAHEDLRARMRGYTNGNVWKSILRTAEVLSGPAPGSGFGSGSAVRAA